MAVLIFREFIHPAVSDRVDEHEERSEWRVIPGDHKDRDDTKAMLESDVEEARYAIHESTGEDDGPTGFTRSEIVKVKRDTAGAISLRKVG